MDTVVFPFPKYKQTQQPEHAIDQLPGEVLKMIGRSRWNYVPPIELQSSSISVEERRFIVRSGSHGIHLAVVTQATPRPECHQIEH